MSKGIHYTRARVYNTPVTNKPSPEVNGEDIENPLLGYVAS
jgi:hypothetical protein